MEDLASSDQFATSAAQGGAARTSQAEFNRFYQDHGVEIMAFVAARVGIGQAEDACQEIWLKVAASRHQFTGGSFRGWLFEITRNHLIDRSRRREVKQAQRTIAIHGADGEGQPTMLPIAAPREHDEDERLERLRSCLDSLDPTYQRIVRGRLSSVDYADIAAQLDLSIEQTQRRFHTAKENLRRCIEGRSE